MYVCANYSSFILYKLSVGKISLYYCRCLVKRFWGRPVSVVWIGSCDFMSILPFKEVKLLVTDMFPSVKAASQYTTISLPFLAF